MVRELVFLLLLWILLPKNSFAVDDPSSLVPGDSYTYDDSKDITSTDDLLGNGSMEKVVFYTAPPNSRNAYVMVVDLKTNKVLSNDKIPDSFGEAFVVKPSGVYEFESRSHRKFILASCAIGPAAGGFFSVYSWDGKKIRRMAAPWKIKGDIVGLRVQKIPRSNSNEILVDHAFSRSDLYVLDGDHFVLRNDLKTPQDENKYLQVGKIPAEFKSAYEAREYLTGTGNTKAISICKEWLSENEKKGSQASSQGRALAANYHGLLGNALQFQGDEEGALEEYSIQDQAYGATNKHSISATNYTRLGDFYWYMGDMFKAKLSYEKALPEWEAYRSANPLKIHNGKMPKDHFLDGLNSKIQEIDETSSESNN